MKNRLILILLILAVVGLYLLQLIPPNNELPNTDGLENVSVEKADKLYHEEQYHEAIKYYYVLAKQDEVYSQYETGFMYFYGQGIKSDICESTYWFDKAARGGYGFAQYELARAYYEGYGISRDYTKAFLWINEALKNLRQQSVKKRALEIVQRQYEDIKTAVSKSNKLAEARSLSASWRYQAEKPVNIIRLRKISIFDQVLTKYYKTLPCDYFKFN